MLLDAFKGSLFQIDKLRASKNKAESTADLLRTKFRLRLRPSSPPLLRRRHTGIRAIPFQGRRSRVVVPHHLKRLPDGSNLWIQYLDPR